KATEYVTKSLNLSVKIRYKKGLGNSYNILGVIYEKKGNYPLSLEYHKKALTTRIEIAHKKGEASSYNNIAIIYDYQGNYPEALKNLFAALKINEEIGNRQWASYNLGNIGDIYVRQGNYKDALAKYNESIKINKELNDKYGIALDYNGISDLFKAQGKFTEALNYLYLSIRILIEIDEKLDLAVANNGIGILLFKQGKYSQALKYCFKAIRICNDYGYKQALSETYLNIGKIYSSLNKPIEARNYLEKGLKIGKDLKSLELIKTAYESLSNLDNSFAISSQAPIKQKKDYALKALLHYKLYINARDSLINTENSKKTVQTQMQYDFNKKELLIKAEQEKKDVINNKELQRQKLVRNGFIGGFGIVLLFAGIFFRQRNKIKKGNEELQIAKERAEQSERYEQQFLANMSHEIRTPMNAVMGMTNLLINKNPRADQLAYLDGIKNSSHNLLYIINDILDLSKIESGKIELEQIDFFLYDVIEQVKQTLDHKAEEKGLFFRGEIGHNVPEVVIGDPVRLNQVLINLVGNAIKFTEKGSITILVDNCQLPVANEQQKVGASLKFSIIDTGIGIPKDKLQTVFESFKQAHSSDSRKYGGTGLGLTISKQYVELMGGTISIESQEGTGTTFSFIINLPLGSVENIQAQKSAEQIDGSILNGLKILLSDDNEYNRTVARDSLISVADVIIKDAVNGKEVIELLKKEDFDVVLMDVQMPIMDGYEATRYIRERMESPMNKVPVIALTASVIKSDLDKCREAGMNDYVPKPFIVSQLVSAIAKATGREIKFREKMLLDIEKRETKKTSITNLTYLEKFCEGDRIRIKKYIEMFINSLPNVIGKIESAYTQEDFNEIAVQLHGLKTKLIMMGMNETKALAMEIEQECREGNFIHDFKGNIKTLIYMLKTSLKELQNLP
ncbi:MAG TPA: tetratricopeptide repeat protein, partial [Saprospiraceae bacterium]|nr:tetratricopeptide repeat protein [Saprospiraceae bacterium]